MEIIKNTYQIQYTDNTYRMVDWTEYEFELIGKHIANGTNAVVLDEGIFVLRDIRAVVLIPPMEEEPKQEDENQLSEYGHYDADTINWLRANGVDVTKGGSKG